ncbi:hypothetical protein [Arthrobacter mobilis]|uniref:Uncharacterized protein n=1 Tax=Arthrobacter mobilis TaxID=2724944 RepID=A0A7X6K5A7_9MICC|nr:hypothetical protein [Arthrobacter mobilis]NKX56257.1 hypothetical protein [Arthrobacter mobilis]
MAQNSDTDDKPKDDKPKDDKPKPLLGLSGTQTIGSALAAVTSALVGSFLGVAGTLIGAALGSVIATVGGAIYARTLTTATTIAMKKIPGRRSLAEANGGMLGAAAAAAAATEAEPAVARERRKLAPGTWLKIGAVSAAAFVLAMVGITAVEFGTNKPISNLVRATSTSDSAPAEQTTTLGQFLGGTEPASRNTEQTEEEGEPAAPEEQGTAPAEDSLDGTGTETGGPTGEDPGQPAPEEPGTGEADTTVPEEPAPGTEPAAPEELPAPEPAEPEVPEDGTGSVPGQ